MMSMSIDTIINAAHYFVIYYATCFIGSFDVPERISPSTIYLLPPEKLVIEVKASGGYSGIIWNKDGNALLGEFTHFREIFVREPTNTNDYGTYDVFYSRTGGVGTSFQVAPLSMNIAQR